MLRAMPAPPSAEQRETATAIRDTLIRARMPVAQGTIDARLTAVRVAGASAREHGLPSLAARASLAEAALLVRHGDYQQATAAGRSAFMEAARLGAWDVAARAGILLAGAIGDAKGSRVEGEMWADLVAVAIAHAGDPMKVNEAARLGALAQVHANAGAVKLGLGESEEALRITRSALGTTHPDTAQAMVQHAVLLSASGRYEDARVLYVEAIELQEAALGRDHPYVAFTLSNLGGLLSRMGRFPESNEAVSRAIEILKVDYQSDHPRFAHALASLGSSLLFSERRASRSAFGISTKASSTSHEGSSNERLPSRKQTKRSKSLHRRSRIWR